jgi:ABC-type multidrug transport system ATPase subunit
MDEMTLNVRTAAVRVDGLSRRYGATRALDGVDLMLERGITGLLGPNGADGSATCRRSWGITGTSRSPGSWTTWRS